MPDWKRIVRERIIAVRPEAAGEVDLAEEIAQHLEDRYRELRTGGAGEKEAFRMASSELDDMYPMREELERAERMAKYDAVPAGDAKPANLLEEFWRDVRYAGRTMRKNPMFVLVVVLTLALGIGANSTVFTLINTLVLNPLPVPDSAGLFAVTTNSSESKSTAPMPISYADLKDYETKNGVFQSLAGYTSVRLVTWQAGETSERMFSEFVTGNYFSTLGIKPAKGRFFLPEEDSKPGAHAVVVMNYGTWQTRFGATPDAVGKTLRLNNTEYTVVGIAPHAFIGVNGIFGPDFWMPAAMAEQSLPTEMQAALSDRGKAIFTGLGRLKPGISRTLAQANIALIASALARAYPETNEGHVVTVRPVREVVFGSSMGGSSAVLFASM